MATHTPPIELNTNTPQSVPMNNPLVGFRRVMGNALIITRREVADSFRDWRILAPIVILTFLFPFLAQFVATQFTNYVDSFGARLIGERTVPFLLMIVGFFPISISLVIALETFVGEKERRSLEPLLSTPLTNTELYIGKTLAAMIPPLLSSFGGMAVYMLSLFFGEYQWRPQFLLVVQIILLTGVQALVMVAGAVVVSSQTNSTRAANLLASFIIIPMALIIQGESVIMFMAPDAESPNGIGALWAIIVGMVVVAILFLRVGNSLFNREELLGNIIDKLNIRGFFGKVWRYARAVDENGTPAKNIIEWYTRAIPFTLRQIRPAIKIAGVVFVIGFVAGNLVAMHPDFRLPLPPQDVLLGARGQLHEFVFRVEVLPMGFIIDQNIRVIILTFMLGMFSFGVMGLVIPPITLAVLGYICGTVFVAGYNPIILAGSILPHGIIELSVLLIASASALAMGAVVTRPPKGSTVGHAWTVRLGDSLKLFIGVIIPGLLLAAVIESIITPRIALWALGMM